MAKPKVMSLFAVVAVVAALALAACGGSSKPAYCHPVSKLKDSVSNLSASEGLTSLKDQLTKIANNAESAVSAAKKDFSSQTTAVETAVTNLKNDLEKMSSPPSTSQLATAATGVSAVVTSVDKLVTAVHSKCG